MAKTLGFINHFYKADVRVAIAQCMDRIYPRCNLTPGDRRLKEFGIKHFVGVLYTMIGFVGGLCGLFIGYPLYLLFDDLAPMVLWVHNSLTNKDVYLYERIFDFSMFVFFIRFTLMVLEFETTPLLVFETILLSVQPGLTLLQKVTGY